MKTVKTIDIQAKEWFDKVNGNSYFAAEVTVNFGLADQQQVILPFQYGYGDHYIDRAAAALEKAGIITDRDEYTGLTRYCREKGIILIASKQENCKQRDVKSFGSTNA